MIAAEEEEEEEERRSSAHRHEKDCGKGLVVAREQHVQYNCMCFANLPHVF
jgi:hypothetical protein